MGLNTDPDLFKDKAEAVQPAVCQIEELRAAFARGGVLRPKGGGKTVGAARRLVGLSGSQELGRGTLGAATPIAVLPFPRPPTHSEELQTDSGGLKWSLPGYAACLDGSPHTADTERVPTSGTRGPGEQHALIPRELKS